MDMITLAAAIALSGGGGSGTSFEPVIVNVLPPVGEKGYLYLVPNGDEGENMHDEYIWIPSLNRYEKLAPKSIPSLPEGGLNGQFLVSDGAGGGRWVTMVNANDILY